jgi:FixJ family two-component response regulator
MYRTRTKKASVTSTKSALTIFVIDPDTTSTKAIGDLARARKLNVASFSSAEEFWDALPREHSGCLVLEVDLPGMSGMMLQERMHNAGIVLPVVMVAVEADVAIAVQAMRRGAVDFLQKPWHPLALWEAIQLALQKDASLRREQAARAALQSRVNSLTEDERLVMDLVLKGLPKKAIAKQTDLSVRTIDFRRASILRKMHVNSLIELAQIMANSKDPTTPAQLRWGNGECS